MTTVYPTEHYTIERTVHYHPLLGEAVRERKLMPLDSFLKENNLTATVGPGHPKIVNAYLESQNVSIEVRLGMMLDAPRGEVGSFIVRTTSRGSDRARDLGKKVFEILEDSYFSKDMLEAVAKARSAE
jgi:hypothetical protein